MGKTKQKGKTHNYPLKRKSYSSGHVGIGGQKEKVTVSKSPSGLTYFDKLKKEQIQSSCKFFSFVVFTHSYLETVRFSFVIAYGMNVSYIL